MGKHLAKKKTVQKETGRPSGYSKELGLKICEHLSLGESLRHILLIEGMPTQSMVFRWLADNEEFREQYRVAREMQMESHLEQIQEIAHDGRNDWEVIESERTGQERIILNAEAVQRSRLRVDTLKWVMSKLAPKKYGDKIEVENTGVQPIIKLTIGGDAN